MLLSEESKGVYLIFRKSGNFCDFSYGKPGILQISCNSFGFHPFTFCNAFLNSCINHIVPISIYFQTLLIGIKVLF